MFNFNIMKSFSQSKRQFLLSILIFTICIFSLIVLFNASKYINNNIELNIKNKFPNRDIFAQYKENLNYEDVIKDIKTINNVNLVYKYARPLVFNSEVLGTASLIGVPNEYFNNLLFDIRYKTKDDYIIIPSNIQIDSSKKSSVDLLGKEIYLNYNDMFTFKVTVAGIYDFDFKDNENITSNIYTSIDSFDNFVYSNNIYEYNNSLHVIANSQKNVDTIIKEMQNKGYISYLNNQSGELELRLYSDLQSTIDNFITIILIFISIVISLVVGSILSKENENIALLKAIGYKNVDIGVITYFTLLCPILISYFISIFLYYFFLIICNYIPTMSVVNKMLKNSDLNIILIIIPIFLFMLLIIIIVYNYKVKKISIIKLIYEK